MLIERLEQDRTRIIDVCVKRGDGVTVTGVRKFVCEGSDGAFVSGQVTSCSVEQVLPALEN